MTNSSCKNIRRRWGPLFGDARTFGFSAVVIGLAWSLPVLFPSPMNAASEDPTDQTQVYQVESPMPHHRAQGGRSAVAEPRTGATGSSGSSSSHDQSSAKVTVTGSARPTIVGRVLYRGPLPAPIQKEVNRDQDVCGTTISMETVMVDAATHGLQNAVVHVEQGPGAMLTGAVPAIPTVIRNTKCRFLPHVAAAQLGGEIESFNDDPVMHNTNITVAGATALNVAMVAGGPPIKKLLKTSGLHVVKCNVHKFMQAYRLVFDHPYFAQTAESGQFTIVGVAPGTHLIKVWHETLGVIQKEVQVPARGTVVVDLEYK
jgi:hypothetical protein